MIATAPPSTPTPRPDPAGTRLLRDDPLARAAAWLWLSLPRRAVARMPFLRDVAGDGYVVAAVPAVAVFLPIVALAGGFWVGATHYGYTLAATESVFLLSALLALGAFATQLALVALVGYALGDFFVRFHVWTYQVVDFGNLDLSPGAASPVRPHHTLLDDGIVAGLLRVRVPLVLMYLLLGLGAVVVPRLARSVAGIAVRSVRLAPDLDWLVASFAYVVTLWLALTGWAASLPLLIRPYFTWKGGLIGKTPPASATVPIQHFRKEIVAVAVAAAILRQLLVLAVERLPGAAARLDVVTSLASPPEPAHRPGRRGVVMRIVGTALVGALLIAGTLERPWTWALAIGVFLVIGLLRSPLLPAGAAARWQRAASRIPFLVRLVGVVVAVRVVAGLLAGSVIVSYEGLAVFILVAALVSVLLLPPVAAGTES